MHLQQPIILGLFVAVAAMSVAARWLRVPYPILLVLGGLVIGVIPGMPRLTLEPDLVLAIFLPPLLYVAAFFAPLREMREMWRVITMLSVGLVIATAAAVAVATHALIGLPWAAAFTLGAVVSPTDPLAATQILSRLRAPRRVSAVLEGEGLINDGTALVIYRAAVGAAVGGTFSAWDAGARLALAPIGGVLVGLAVGWLVSLVRERIDDTPTEITISLFTGYAAYLPAEALGASGVIAAVTAGLVLGWRGPRIAGAATRLQGFAFWDILVFLLNSTLFILIGLQLPTVLDGLGQYSTWTLIGYGAAVSGVVVGARIAWVFGTTALIRAVDHRPSVRAIRSTWRQRMIVSWSGMRGAVSLAAALAIPIETDAGTPFPGRPLILFLTFAVILFTLVVQGLTLPVLIRGLGVPEDGEEEREEIRARLAAAKAALARLDELEGEPWVREDSLERMRRFYEFRKRRFAARAGKVPDDGYEEQSVAYQRLTRHVLEAQRRAVVRLRNQGTISNEVMHRIEREIDLEDSRLEDVSVQEIEGEREVAGS